VWASGAVWTGKKNLAPTGIRSADHPARSESKVASQMSGNYYRFSIFFLLDCGFDVLMRKFLRQTISEKKCLVFLCLPENAEIIVKLQVAMEFFLHIP